jgi:hypothetical protein
MIMKLIKSAFFVKISAIFLILSLSSTGLQVYAQQLEVKSTENYYGNVVSDGTIDSWGSPTAIAGCTDPALSYVNCDKWLSKRPSSGAGYHGRTVINDRALSAEMWYHLEQYEDNYGLKLDIVKYVNNDPSRYDLYKDDIGKVGVDTNLNDATLEFKEGSHGLSVASAFMSIARQAEVIYINWESFVDSNGKLDQNGLYKIFYWINKNADIENIKVVSMSITTVYNYNEIRTSLRNIVSDVAIKDVFMVSSIGNDGKDRGNLFPQSHPQVFAVGAIDHENRGRFWWEPDYYSKKNYFSGSSKHAWDYYFYCHDPEETPFCSSYGTTLSSNPQYAIHFVMPGNGIPVMVDTNGGWRYTFGTSASTPYLAAAALIAHYGYVKGYNYKSCSTGGSTTVSLIHSLLRSSSVSYSHFSNDPHRYGYGFINLESLYSNSYSSGYNNAPMCGGGGGGGGGWF